MLLSLIYPATKFCVVYIRVSRFNIYRCISATRMYLICLCIYSLFSIYIFICHISPLYCIGFLLIYSVYDIPLVLYAFADEPRYFFIFACLFTAPAIETVPIPPEYT